jgi:hypothetical protein
MDYEVNTDLRGKSKNYYLESTPNLFIGISLSASGTVPLTN